jgi:Ca2+-dependent lipid-binding protein
MDGGYWPVFATSKARTTTAVWDSVGEGFLKELDFGRVCLRLNEREDGEKEDIIAEYKSDARTFLQKALDGPTDFTLANVDGGYLSTVKIAAKFVPVPIKLSARESLNSTLFIP